MASAGQIPNRNLGRQSWSPRPTEATLAVHSGRAAESSAPTKDKESPINHPGQRRGWEDWVGIGAEIIPKGAISFGQSLSHGCAVPAPFTQGSLWDGGCGLPRRFAPRNDSPDPLSFRGGPTGRRGNPSFFRWTGVWAAVPRAWPPPPKFRTEIWGVGQVVGPCGCAAHRVIPRSAGWEQGVYRGSQLWYTGGPDFTRG